MNAIRLLIVCSMVISQPLTAQTWKGTIVKQGDVVVVKNPKTPLYPDGTFSVKEELSIGGEAMSAEAAISAIIDLAVTDDGRICIGDVKQTKILVFDAQGRFLISFGKRGQGPGEFLNPVRLSVRNKSSEVFVDGMRKGVVFGLDGKFKENVRYPSDMLTVKTDEFGSLVGMLLVYGDKNDHSELIKFPPGEAGSVVLAKSPIIDVRNPDPFMPRLAWCLRGDGVVLEGYPERYEINIHDPQGRIVKSISRAYDPVAVTARDKEDILKATPPGVLAEAPPHFSSFFSAYQRIAADEKGYVFVQTWERTSDRKSYMIDVFDPEGRYIAKLDGLGTLRAAKQDKLYLTDEDAEGYQLVKRYAMEWKK